MWQGFVNFKLTLKLDEKSLIAIFCRSLPLNGCSVFEFALHYPITDVSIYLLLIHICVVTCYS